MERGGQGDVGPAATGDQRHQTLCTETVAVGNLDVGHATERRGAHIVVNNAHADVEAFAGQIKILVGECEGTLGSSAREGADEEEKKYDTLCHGELAEVSSGLTGVDGSR